MRLRSAAVAAAVLTAGCARGTPVRVRPGPGPLATVAGEVQSADGLAAEYETTVLLYRHLSGAPRAWVRTAPDGTFAFTALPPGWYQLRAMRIGLKAGRTARFRLRPGESAHVRFVLPEERVQLMY